MSIPSRLQLPKKQILVPLWLKDTDNPALARMARRPILIAIDELGMVLPGVAQEMTVSRARVLPDSLLYLPKSLYVEIMFRFDKTIYTLSGTSSSSCRDNSFWLKFDTVARKTMSVLNGRLEACGLLEAGEREPAREATAAPQSARMQASGSTRKRSGAWPMACERRAHRRYGMEAEARLTVMQNGQLVDCEMVDLSLSGCRLHRVAGCELECGTQVEVQFIGNGFPLRLAAVVQVRIDKQTAGLRFVHVSERMRDRLGELIGEIAGGLVVVGVHR